MLKLIYLACLTLLACTTEGHAKFSKIEKHKLQIKALHSEYRSEESFHGIIEAFKHRESTAGRLFVRSDPQRRDGLYFVVSFRSAIRLIPANSKITIHFITDSNPHEECHSWQIPSTQRHFSNTLYLGLTDGRSAATKVICWHVILSDSNNTPLSELHSFAWEMPDEAH